MKITSDVIDVWVTILRDVEGSRLLLQAPQFEKEATAERRKNDDVNLPT